MQSLQLCATAYQGKELHFFPKAVNLCLYMFVCLYKHIIKHINDIMSATVTASY